MNMTFERSVLTDKLVTALRGVNGEVSYTGLSRQLDSSVGQVKALLASARRILRNEKILFGVIRGEGLKRLGDIDKVRKSEANKKRIANAARRGLKELETIEQFDKLSNSDQIIATTNRTILNLTRQYAKAKIDTAPKDEIAKPDVTQAAVNLVKLRK